MFGRNEGETVGGSELRAPALMVLVFVLGLATSICASPYLLPAVAFDSIYPALAADGVTFIVIGATVFLAWSVRRTLVIGAVTWLTLALVAWVLSANGVLTAPFSLALGSLGVGMGFAVATAHMLGHFRAALTRRQAQLRALSVRLMSVQEEERRRLSREIHDGLSQSLTAVSSYLWLLDQQLPADQETLRRLSGDARRLLAQTLGEMRELSQRLCPPLLELYGLVPSLEAHVKAFEARHKIATRLDASGFPARLPVNVETALYRITQEALTNVARHACARRARVALAAAGGEIRLDIEDDGIGLPTDDGAVPNGTGLTGIAERVRALDGTLAISSDRGTHLHIRLPVAAEEGSEVAETATAEAEPDTTFGTIPDAAREEQAPRLDA